MVTALKSERVEKFHDTLEAYTLHSYTVYVLSLCGSCYISLRISYSRNTYLFILSKRDKVLSDLDKVLSRLDN